MRITDGILDIPSLPLMLVIIAVAGRGLTNIILVIGLLSWTYMARVVRSQVLTVKERQFVMRARAIGVSHLGIVIYHILPQVLPVIFAEATLDISYAILSEASLSFLGLGIQEPLISWGFLMRDAQNIETLGSHPWIMTPAVFIVVAVLGFNFLGDGLRDAADPYSIV